MADIEKSILNTRAWAFQERLLSRRILHYTNKQIYWECRSEFWAEDLIPRKRLPMHPYPGIIASRLLNVYSESNEGVLLLWYDMLISQSYAARKITYSSDRLPAVSALASVISHFTNSSYLAGLWDYNLPEGLSWYRTGAVPPASRLSNECPSWSWASLDSKVTWHSRGLAAADDEPFIHIEESFVNLEGTDPFGRVRGGFIKLRGRVKRCTLAGHEPALLDIIAEDGTYLGRADMDTSEPVSQAYCLLLYSYSRRFVGSGLMLSLTSAERQDYRRLGFARLHPLDWPYEGNTPFQDSFQNCTEQTIILI